MPVERLSATAGDFFVSFATGVEAARTRSPASRTSRRSPTSARAGLSVELEQAALGHVPPGIEVSIYRIVEEALTNALKHAPGSGVRVRLARTESSVAIEVVNGPPHGRRHISIASGHGLTGLRERVSLYGGTVEARPTADGGFCLAASMPVVEAA